MPLVPVAFAVVYRHGTVADIDRFWTSVLGAGFVCYISLPWLVSRPPRLLEQVPRDVSHVRRLNLHVLNRVSHGCNSFPSGHVAVAVSAALSAWSVAPYVGVVFVLVALGVAVGSVRGRYHYAIDAAAGALVGLAATLVAWFV